MKLSWTLINGIVFFQALVFSLLLTPVSITLGKRFGLIDHPKIDRFHKQTKVRSGGIAIFLGFAIAALLDLVLVYFLYKNDALFQENVSRLLGNVKAVLPRLIGLMAGASFIFLVGLVDDRFTLRPRTKLLCQVLSAVPLLLVGIRIRLFLPAGFGILLTMFWIVLLTNSFNLLDNMDGLASGTAIIVSLVFSFVSWQAGNRFMTVILILLAGSIMGFWYFNFIKSRLFMGDGGSHFIGYMIAALSIQATYYKTGAPTSLPVLTPLVILAVPLFDTISVMFIRFREGRPLMKGDTNHFSHRLVSLGMSPRQAVVFIYLVTVCVALAAMPLGYLPLVPALVQFSQVVFWFFLIFLIERAGKRKLDEEKNKLRGVNE